VKVHARSDDAFPVVAIESEETEMVQPFVDLGFNSKPKLGREFYDYK
jgi:hypothetical protein